MTAWKQRATAYGAELLTGCGQFRVGHGRHVTDWCDTEETAWRRFCEIAGLDFATEPTEQGNQYVLPGCEKDRSRGPSQGDLF